LQLIQKDVELDADFIVFIAAIDLHAPGEVALALGDVLDAEGQRGQRSDDLVWPTRQALAKLSRAKKSVIRPVCLLRTNHASTESNCFWNSAAKIVSHAAKVSESSLFSFPRLSICGIISSLGAPCC